jgi:signal peptidase I
MKAGLAWLRRIVGWTLLTWVVVFWGLVLFKGMRFFVVPSGSMAPTLKPNDFLVVLREGDYVRGDIVVARDLEDPDGYLIKRIVAMGGDTVEVRRGRLILNGVTIEEPYLQEPMEYAFGPIEVSDDEVFLLGDSRNESEDGHVWQSGYPVSAIVGRVCGIYYPPERIRRIPGQETAP